MSGAMVQAVGAAVLASIGVVELAAVAGRRTGPRRRLRPAELLARWGRRLGAPGAPRDLAARLAAAGLDERVPVGEAMAVKAGAALAALLAALPLAAAAPGRAGVAVLLTAPAAGYLAPDLELGRRARRRAARMALELPDILDLVRVAVDAGLPAVRAMGEAGRRHGGLLGAELAATAGRVGLGEPRELALDRLSARAPLPEVAAFVAALRRAERHGSPPSAALQALAADARAARARAVRDRAARAAPKIQLVVALLLVPAVLLLVAAGLIQGLSR